MTTQYSYDSGAPGTITRREEFADDIAIMSPMDTPLHNILSYYPVANTEYSWNVDEIATPTSVSSQLEGSAPSAANKARTRLRNICMIDHKGIDVSDTQRVMNEAGIDDEFSWQVVQKGLELLKQCEFNLHWSTYQAGAAATARQYAGIIEWAFRGGWARNQGGSEPVAGYDVPSRYGGVLYEGTNSNLTEAQFRDSVLQPAWRYGMEIPQAICLLGARLKAIVSDFGVVYNSGGTIVNSMFIEAEKRRKILTIDVFETDYGPLSLALDRYMDDTSVSATFDPVGESSAATGVQVAADDSLLILEPNYVKIAALRALQYSPLGKDSDSTEGYVVAEEGLRVSNPIALALATGIKA